MSPPDGLPEAAWVVALASLDGMGPARLRALLARWSSAEAWRRVAAGRVPPPERTSAPGGAGLLRRWRDQAAELDVAARWAAHRDAGIGVLTAASPAFPAALLGDPEPPAVLFSAGDPAAVRGARVAVVGTRDCTRYGFDVARGLGAGLAGAGVGVVSGLALGIDGAAHAGALDAGGAPPVAVVGSGLDRCYPARHAALWRRVAAAGVVLSEHPLGTPPRAWHFPSRNRLIAGLADVVVVVESQERGGAMLTVEAALARGVQVMAVPGPVTGRCSDGPNRLLSEGCAPARDVADVLVALDLSAPARAAVDPRPAPDPAGLAVLESLGWQPATFDQLAARTGRPVGELAPVLHRLVEAGWVAQRGGWFERAAAGP